MGAGIIASGDKQAAGFGDLAERSGNSLYCTYFCWIIFGADDDKVIIHDIKALDAKSFLHENKLRRFVVDKENICIAVARNAKCLACTNGDNPDINAVLIATRHSSHGDLTARALLANKNVLVEKPLALDRAELNAIVKARRQTDAFFQVGFNRRYAPLAIAARDHLEAAGGNRFVLIRVNAGPVEPEIWFNAPEEGGGRVLGEACHFVDLARYFVGAPIVGVHAGAARVGQGVCDDLTITLNFADGGLATIAYTALGDTAYSKELIECYAGGAVVTIDDFRRLTVATGGKVTRPRKSTTQDKGHAAQLKAFVDAVASGGGAPVDEAELFETSLATIAVMESLQTGETVKL